MTLYTYEEFSSIQAQSCRKFSVPRKSIIWFSMHITVKPIFHMDELGEGKTNANDRERLTFHLEMRQICVTPALPSRLFIHLRAFNYKRTLAILWNLGLYISFITRYYLVP